MTTKFGNKKYRVVPVGATVKAPGELVNNPDFVNNTFNLLARELAKRLKRDGLIEELIEPIPEERGGGVVFVSRLLVLVEEREGEE